MSSEITVARVQQYGSDVYFLAQQQGSRLNGRVRKESVRGKTAFFDRVGSVTAVLRVSRHADTPQIDTPHTRRMVALADYEFADLIDDMDKIRMLWDPAGPYVKTHMWAHGRAMDDVILDAASGTAATGETGSGTQTLGNGQKIASISGGAGAKLNVTALRAAARILDGGNVDPRIPRHFAYNALQKEALLTQTEVTSADYNVVRALVAGQVDTFMGFSFVHTQQINNQGSALSFSLTTGAVGSGAGDSNGYNKCLAWAEDGILLGIGQDIKAQVGPRADKSYSTQVYTSMSLGAVRMEEEKIVEVHCVAS